MRYFISKKFIFILAIILIKFFIANKAIASGGGSWEPSYDPNDYPEGYGDADSYGIWVCSLQVKLTRWLPSTPYSLWLSTLANRMISDIPFLGRGIIVQTINNIKNVLLLVAAWKVFKSLPGRF